MLKRYINSALGFWRDKRDEHLHWALVRQKDAADLRQARKLAEQDLLAQLRIQAQELAHALSVMSIRHDSELAKLKIQCKQDLKDYQQYLQSLETLKLSLRESFAHLPEAVVFTIHHHAKQLLNRMWETQDSQEKLKIEMQLIRFLTAVHEDSLMSLNGTSPVALPQKTLAFLDKPAQIG